jgi:uncharacterized membrane protein YbhN (UPF0104 family)
MTRNLLILAAKIAVTGGLIYLVLRDVDPAGIGARLKDLSPAWLIAAAALIFAQNALIVTWRWERVVATIDTALPPWRLLRPVVVSLFFNQVLPSTIGGDGMRIWLLCKLDHPLGRAFRSVLIDRLLGLFGLLLLGLLGAVYLIQSLKEPGPAWTLLPVSLAGLTLIAAAPVLVRLMGWLPLPALRERLHSVAREVSALARNKRRLLELVGASVIGQLALSCAIILIMVSLGIPVDPLGALAVMPGVMVAASIPISIAGWGVREGTMVVGLGLLGVAQADAALVSIAFGLLLLSFGLAGGLLWLVTGGHRPTQAELDPAAEAAAAGRGET